MHGALGETSATNSLTGEPLVKSKIEIEVAGARGLTNGRDVIHRLLI